MRPAFTLGGISGGIAVDEAQLRQIASAGLVFPPITQILVEKCISGWKEIEFEVMRDGDGNVITICSMENVDPVGIHTGDSIVIAPAVTLADKEYQMLRSAALHIIEAMGIEGGCNVQFALNPESFEYAVIEVNPRGFPFLRPCQQSDRLSDRQSRCQNRHRLPDGRNQKRNHRQNKSMLRTGIGLCCRQISEMAL